MRGPHPDCTDPLEWYRQSYEIAADGRDANRRLALPMAVAGEHPDDREAYIERATAEAQIALDLGEAA